MHGVENEGPVEQILRAQGGVGAVVARVQQVVQ